MPIQLITTIKFHRTIHTLHSVSHQLVRRVGNEIICKHQLVLVIKLVKFKKDRKNTAPTSKFIGTQCISVGLKITGVLEQKANHFLVKKLTADKIQVMDEEVSAANGPTHLALFPKPRTTLAIEEADQFPEFDLFKNGFTILDKFYPMINRGLDLNRPSNLFCSYGRNRELILVDVHSASIQSLYQQLKQRITENTAHPYEDLFNQVVELIRQVMPVPEIQTALQQPTLELISNNGSKIPVVFLDNFIRHRCGVCRHVVLLGLLLIRNLVQQKLLPTDCQLYARRETFIDAENKSTAHVWVECVLPKDSRQFLIDPLNRQNLRIVEVTPSTICNRLDKRMSLYYKSPYAKREDTPPTLPCESPRNSLDDMKIEP